MGGAGCPRRAQDPSPSSNAESSDRAEAPSRSSNLQPLTWPAAGDGRSPLRLCLGGCGREPRATCDVCEECEATVGPLAPRETLYAGGECQVCGSRAEGSTHCEVCEPALRLTRLIQEQSGLGPVRRTVALQLLRGIAATLEAVDSTERSAGPDEQSAASGARGGAGGSGRHRRGRGRGRGR